MSSTRMEESRDDDSEALMGSTYKTSAGTKWLNPFPRFNIFAYRQGMARAVCLLVVLAAGAVLLESQFLGFLSKPSAHTLGTLVPAVVSEPLPAAERYSKPQRQKIIALIFYGRRDRASILDCYLRENLVTNGGWLDEVIWGVNTEIVEDLAYLEHLIPTSPSYRRLELDEKGYTNLWNASVERGNIYIKLDDDVVYMHRDTIPNMVHTLMTDPTAVIVSANMINSPEHNWIQYRTRAVHAFLPDLEPPNHGTLSSTTNPIWKVADLPVWRNATDWEYLPDGDLNKELLKFLPSGAEGEEVSELAPHRWLPLSDPLDISKTPIAKASYDPFGPGWKQWGIAAQQHYSFFQNLETGQLGSYYLNHGFGVDAPATWDHTGDRLSINMLAVTGDMILENWDDMARFNDDERFLTLEIPRITNKRKFEARFPVLSGFLVLIEVIGLLVHTQALACHYAFGPQLKELDSTDILPRYRAYAQENVCQDRLPVFES
jgi:hypothetical protein